MPSPIYDHPEISRRYFFPQPATPLQEDENNRRVDLKLGDGTSLSAFAIQVCAGAPTLLILHGNGESMADQLEHWPLWAAAIGVNLFLLDYPGYADSEGEPSLSACRRAARAALEHVLARPEAEVPAVFVNVMRGGPGLGNIGPSQSDIKLVCRGLGHGDTHAIVLAPSTPQEMLDLTMEAFRLAFVYRNPVIVAPDGYLGQMTGRVQLPDYMLEPGIPGWAVYGDAKHRGNLINSIHLSEPDLEAHNEVLQAKFARIAASEQRAATYRADDARILVVAASTPARMAKSAIEHLRQEGVAIGLFNPVTLWPFPVDALRPLMEHVEDILVVEASAGQLEDELRLAMSHADLGGPRIHHLRRMGGMLPQEPEIRARVHEIVGSREVRS